MTPDSRTAWLILPTPQEASDAVPEPAFSEATEDGGGCQTLAFDSVRIEVG